MNEITVIFVFKKVNPIKKKTVSVMAEKNNYFVRESR